MADGEKVPQALKAAREAAYQVKWDDLARRGITKPKDEKERQERLKAAHDVID